MGFSRGNNLRSEISIFLLSKPGGRLSNGLRAGQSERLNALTADFQPDGMVSRFWKFVKVTFSNWVNTPKADASVIPAH